MSLNSAIELAKASTLDLVEVSPNAAPPVCRVMDFGKHLFEQKKKSHAGKVKQRHTQLKEVKFRPGTDIDDYQVKMKNLVKFLSAGDKTKVTLRFRGREMAHQQLGMQLLERVKTDLEEIGTVEQFPKMEGRQLIMVLAQKKT